MRWRRGEKKRKKIRENGERGWLKTTVNFETTSFFLRCSSKRAVRERRSTTSHPPRFSLTFYFENGRNFLPHPPLTCPPTSSTPSPILRLHPQTQRLPWKNSREDEERARRGIAWKQTREIKARHWRSLDGADYFYDVTRRRDGCPEDEMPQPPSISKEGGGGGGEVLCRATPSMPLTVATTTKSRDRNTVSRFRLCAAFYSSPFLRYYTFVAAWWINGHRLGMGRLSGGAPLRYLGSKGIQRGSGELGRFGILVELWLLSSWIFYFFFLKNWEYFWKILDQKFRLSFRLRRSLMMILLVYRNNSGERVLRIIRKRRKKNGRSK